MAFVSHTGPAGLPRTWLEQVVVILTFRQQLISDRSRLCQALRGSPDGLYAGKRSARTGRGPFKSGSREYGTGNPHCALLRKFFASPCAAQNNLHILARRGFVAVMLSSGAQPMSSVIFTVVLLSGAFLALDLFVEKRRRSRQRPVQEQGT